MKTQRYFYFFLWDSELVLIFVVSIIFNQGMWAFFMHTHLLYNDIWYSCTPVWNCNGTTTSLGM